MRGLPEPLVPPTTDLRGFSSFMLDVDRLLASELVALGTPEECWAAVMLWCRAWKQSPPSSLPDDDKVLAAFSGAGKRWPKVREMALRGFVKCSDGRLYHRVLAAEANEAWERRKKFKERSVRANEKRWSKDNPQDEPEGAEGAGGRIPTDPRIMQQAIQQGLPQAIQQGEQQGAHKDSITSPIDRTGQGQDKEKDPPQPPEGLEATRDDIRQAFDAYNETAKHLGLPEARDLTDERRRKVRARLRAAGGIGAWREALSQIGASDFLTGRTERGFRADLDFLCQAKSFQRLIEGYYSDRKPLSLNGHSSSNGHSPPVEDDAYWSKLLRWGRTKHIWSRAEWGPAPNEPGCRAPPHLLQSGDGDGWAEFDEHRGAA